MATRNNNTPITTNPVRPIAARLQAISGSVDGAASILNQLVQHSDPDVSRQSFACADLLERLSGDLDEIAQQAAKDRQATATPRQEPDNSDLRHALRNIATAARLLGDTAEGRAVPVEGVGPQFWIDQHNALADKVLMLAVTIQREADEALAQGGVQ